MRLKFMKKKILKLPKLVTVSVPVVVVALEVGVLLVPLFPLRADPKVAGQFAEFVVAAIRVEYKITDTHSKICK